MVAYIILHYMAEEMTIMCVEQLRSIHKNKMDHIKIIVVDNASSNGSGVRIKNYLAEYDECVVLLSEKNLGFACGNNIGYKYAKKLCPDFIVVMNNDVIIEDFLFLEKLVNAYTETQFYVLGPDIISKKTGEHQNPVSEHACSREMIEYRITELEEDLNRDRYEYYLYHMIKKMKSLLMNRGIKNSTEGQLNSVQLNVILHGACYIFSSKFIEKEDQAFNQNTFLYYEENILHLMCTKNNYTMVYYPDIKVIHYEDVATNFIRQSRYKKMLKQNHFKIDSARILLELMKE